MNWSLILPALVYALLAVGLIYLFAKALFEASIGDRRTFSDKLRLRNKEKQLKSFETVLESGKLEEAFNLLKRALYLEEVRFDIELVDKIANHNAGVLSRILMLADKHGAHLTNLAVVEDLLLNRCELMRAYLEASKGKVSLLKKRRKTVPAWALDEYQRKLEDLADRLNTNRRSLENQLEKMLLFLHKSFCRADVTYH